jgi:hypothetical protein
MRLARLSGRHRRAGLGRAAPGDGGRGHGALRPGGGGIPRPDRRALPPDGAGAAGGGAGGRERRGAGPPRAPLGPHAGGAGAGPAGHPYAHDLDIFGHRLHGPAPGHHGHGRRPPPAGPLAPGARPLETARRRQEAVRELGPLLDFRQDLQVAGRLAGDPDRPPWTSSWTWAEGEPWLLRSPLLVWTARLIPLATFVLLRPPHRRRPGPAWWLVPSPPG